MRSERLPAGIAGPRFVERRDWLQAPRPRAPRHRFRCVRCVACAVVEWPICFNALGTERHGSSCVPGAAAQAAENSPERAGADRGRSTASAGSSVRSQRATRDRTTAVSPDSAPRGAANGVLPGLAVSPTLAAPGRKRRGGPVDSSGDRLPRFGHPIRAPELAGDAGVLVRRDGIADRGAAACRGDVDLMVDDTVGVAFRDRTVPVSARVPGAREQGGGCQREGVDNGNRRAWSAEHSAEASRSDRLPRSALIRRRFCPGAGRRGRS